MTPTPLAGCSSPLWLPCRGLAPSCPPRSQMWAQVLPIPSSLSPGAPCLLALVHTAPSAWRPPLALLPTPMPTWLLLPIWDPGWPEATPERAALPCVCSPWLHLLEHLFCLLSRVHWTVLPMAEFLEGLSLSTTYWARQGLVKEGWKKCRRGKSKV